MRENPWLHMSRETHKALPLRRRSFADTRVLLQQAPPSLEVAIVISTLGHGSAPSPQRLHAGARISPDPV